jgi:hypothetical protein
MVRKPLRLHVDTIVRQHCGKTYLSHLLRHSYRDGTRAAPLASQTKNTCVVVGDDSGSSFEQVSEATPLQAESLRLLQL